MAFMARITESLGLSTVPAIHFRYSRSSSDIEAWQIFKTPDQLTLLAQLAKAYQHRHSCQNAVLVLDGYVILVEFFEDVDAGEDVFDVRLTLDFTAHASSRYSENRAVELVIEQGTENPFLGCNFDEM